MSEVKEKAALHIFTQFSVTFSSAWNDMRAKSAVVWRAQFQTHQRDSRGITQLSKSPQASFLQEALKCLAMLKQLSHLNV